MTSSYIIYLDSLFPESWDGVSEARGNVRKDLIGDSGWLEIVYEIIQLMTYNEGRGETDEEECGEERYNLRNLFEEVKSRSSVSGREKFNNTGNNLFLVLLLS